MQILEIILYLLAYTMGVITIFLEIVCYNKKIEYLETILFTVAFLAFIVSLSFSLFVTEINIDGTSSLNSLVLVTMVFLGLTTALNTFAERKVTIPKSIKILLIVSSSLLLVLIAVNAYSDVNLHIETLVSLFLGVSITTSMLLIRKTKPEKRIEHKERSERILSLIILIVLPISLFIEFFATSIEALKFLDSRITITPPILFILLSASKILDDLNRLSLFKSDNSIKEQNVKNFNFTPRETEIANLLVKGLSYANISESLFIAMPTVKTHVSNIYRKANVKNKIELLNALMN